MSLHGKCLHGRPQTKPLVMEYTPQVVVKKGHEGLQSMLSLLVAEWEHLLRPALFRRDNGACTCHV